MTTGINPMPMVKVQVGFASTPFASPQTWTDISALVQAITIKRGRQHVLSRVEPGRLTLLCDGRGRELDPINTASPYYPNVDLNKQVQVGVIMNALTNAQSLLSAASWVAGANTTLAYGSNILTLTATAGGSVSASTPTGTSGFPVIAGKTYTEIGTLAALVTARSTTMAVTWYTAAGATISTATSAAANDSTSGVARTFAVTAPSNAATASVTYTWAGCLAAEQHTLKLPGLIDGLDSAASFYPGGLRPLFTGFIDSLPVDWQNDLNTEITITATDSMRMLQETDLPADAYVARAVAAGANGVWPLDDPSGSAIVREVVGGAAGLVGPNTLLAQPSRAAVVATTTLAFTAATGMVTMPTPVAVSGSGNPGLFCLEAWFKTSVAGGGIYRQQCRRDPGVLIAGTPGNMNVTMDGSGNIACTIGGDSTGSGTTATASTSGTNYADGNWHLLAVYGDNSNNLHVTVDAVGVAVSAVGISPNFFGNAAVTWGLGFVGSLSALAVWSTAVDPSVATSVSVGKQYFVTPELSTARMVDALGLVGLPAAYYAAAGAGSDAGNSNIMAPTSPLGTTTVTEYLQQVADAEDGMIFARADGVLALYDRHHWVNIGAPSVVFGDNGTTEIGYKGSPGVALDGIDMFNRSATSSAATGVTQVAQNAASQAKYATVRSLDESGLLIATDAESLARAQWNVGRYGTPAVRAQRLTVDVLSQAATSNVVQQLLYNQPAQGIELGGTATLNRRPWSRSAGFAGAALSQANMIEGLTHTIAFKPARWSMDVNLSPVDVTPYWTLGASQLGVNTTLAY